MSQDQSESDRVWNEYRRMLAYLDTRIDVNQSGRAFVAGLTKHLATFGYLSDKQRACIKAMYENHSNPLS